MTDNIEILSPAGSIECLKAAIDAGADAVYFAGTKFGARKSAVNLTNEQIIQAVEYAHLRSARLYVTVNTLVSDSELEDVFEFVKFCYIQGVDAVIVQDLGVVNMIKTYFPDMRIHASTQMTIHNLAGALWAQKAGFDRVVLSRELSFEEIKYIASNSTIELEVFAHGALCMSYSGQCLFSSFLGGRSGNRGACAQPCRLAYTLEDKNGDTVGQKDRYLLSLKDLCLLDHIQELKDIGVTSLKIEGRMKGEAYVSAVSGIYNKYRDGKQPTPEDKKLLEDIFSRTGFTDGYFSGSYGREMLSYSSNHDNIYSSATDEVIQKAKSFSKDNYKTGLCAEFVAKVGSRAKFTVSLNGETFSSVSSSPVEKAANAPVSSQRITEQLQKLGGTVFEYLSLLVDADDDIYISIKEINEMRRQAIDAVKQHILSPARTYEGGKLVVIKPKKQATEPDYSCSVLTFEQAQKAFDLGFSLIYVPLALYNKEKAHFDANPDVFSVKLPPVMHDLKNYNIKDIGTDSVCVTNIGQLQMPWESKKIYADYRLNAFNTLSLKQLGMMGVSMACFSPELTCEALKDIASSIKTELLVYGRVSMMTMRNCVVRSAANKCICKEGDVFYLKDRKNISFPVIPDKTSCTDILYNSVPVVMSDRLKEIASINAHYYRFDFTLETTDEMEEIVNMYENGTKPHFPFTRGHFYNGVI